MKSLYYCRSKSVQRAEDVSTKESGFEKEVSEQQKPSFDSSQSTQANDDYEECLACQ